MERDGARPRPLTRMVQPSGGAGSGEDDGNGRSSARARARERRRAKSRASPPTAATSQWPAGATSAAVRIIRHAGRGVLFLVPSTAAPTGFRRIARSSSRPGRSRRVIRTSRRGVSKAASERSGASSGAPRAAPVVYLKRRQGFSPKILQNRRGSLENGRLPLLTGEAFEGFGGRRVDAGQFDAGFAACAATLL